jgi:hypothetical protein
MRCQNARAYSKHRRRWICVSTCSCRKITEMRATAPHAGDTLHDLRRSVEGSRRSRRLNFLATTTLHFRIEQEAFALPASLEARPARGRGEFKGKFPRALYRRS